MKIYYVYSPAIKHKMSFSSAITYKFHHPPHGSCSRLASTQIREEYIHVPADTYCKKRAEILREFLATGSIFATDEYQRTLEAKARGNVAAEVEMLSTGVIPTGCTEQVVERTEQVAERRLS